MSWSFPDSKFIWRAGTARDGSATPRLLELLAEPDASDEQRYACAWALGRCGGTEAIPALETLARSGPSQRVRRIAVEAQRMLSTGDTLAAFQKKQKARLSMGLRTARTGKVLDKRLKTYLGSARDGAADSIDLSVMLTLYRIGDDAARAALLSALTDIPLKPHWFRVVRTLHKAALYRDDGEFIAAIARRFDGVLAWSGTQPTGSPEQRAYGVGTRVFLRREIWRHLRRLGKAGDAAYVPNAIALLLAYDDELLGAEPETQGIPLARLPRVGWQVSGRRYRVGEDAYAFNHVLLGGLIAGSAAPGTSGWRGQVDRARGRQGRDECRAEAFPQLWDANPEVLTRLLSESQAEVVHTFAVHALRDHPDICASWGRDALLALVSQRYLDTICLGLEEALRRGDLYGDDDLLEAAEGAVENLVKSERSRHRALVGTFIDLHRDWFLERESFVAHLLTSAWVDVRTHAHKVVSEAELDEDQQGGLLISLVEWLLEGTFKSGSDTAKDAASAAVDYFPAAFPWIDDHLVISLLDSKVADFQVVGARAVQRRSPERPTLTWGLLRRLVDSDNAAVRAIGLELICAFTEEQLAEHLAKLIGLLAHKHADVRSGMSPVVERILTRFEWARVMTTELLRRLPSLKGQVATDLVQFFRDRLEPTLRELLRVEPGDVRSTIQGMIDGATDPCRELGMWLLGLLDDETLLADQELLHALATHEQKALRVHVRPILKRLAESSPEFGRSFCDRLLSETTSPEFGGGPYNLHFTPPHGDTNAKLNQYSLARRRQGSPHDDGGLLPAPSGGISTLVPGNVDDRTSSFTNIGFTFRLAGVDLTRFQADSNGWMRFQGSWYGTYSNSRAWDKNDGVAMFPWWADLRTAHDGYVRSWISGDAPNRVRVVEWRCYPNYGMRPNNNITETFQVCLYETSGNVEYRYGPLERTGEPRYPRTTACGLKLDTKRKVEGNVRDFFGLNGTPAGSKPPFRTDLKSDGDAIHYPGTANCGTTLVGSQSGALNARYDDIAETLLFAFESVLRVISMDRVRELLAHPLAAIQGLAAGILLIHETAVTDLPGELIQQLIDSPHANVRKRGLTLFGRLPDEHLLTLPDLIHRLCTHDKADVRGGMTELVARLALLDNAFGLALTEPLLEHVDRKKNAAGEIAAILKGVYDLLDDDALLSAQDVLLRCSTHSQQALREAFGVYVLRLAEAELNFCLTFSGRVLGRVAAFSPVPEDLQKFSDKMMALLRAGLEKLSDDELLEDAELLYGLCTHRFAGMVDVAQPLLLRLASSRPDAAMALAVRLLATLKHADRPAGEPAAPHVDALLNAVDTDTHIAYPDFLLLSCSHGRSRVRRAAISALQQVVDRSADAALEFTEALIGRLLLKAPYEAAHTDLVELANGALAVSLPSVSAHTTWKLLAGRGFPAKELGGQLLAANFTADRISLRKLSELASHELRSVRQTTWGFYRDSVDRMKADMESGLRILDATWDDSREFAFELYRESFGEDELTATVLVSICDSVRLDVQQFGRELITKYFGEEDGPEYLLKLSQHPAPNVELFVTNYLDRYAVDQLDRTKKLLPYFQRVLCRVNRGRVAKDRVLHFLRSESLKDLERAEMISPVFGWLAANAAIGDKATLLTAMLEIHEAYPQVGLPITVQARQVRA